MVGEDQTPIKTSTDFPIKLVQVGQDICLDDATGNFGPPIHAQVPSQVCPLCLVVKTHWDTNCIGPTALLLACVVGGWVLGEFARG